MKNKHCDFNTFLFCTQIKFIMKKGVLNPTTHYNN